VGVERDLPHLGRLGRLLRPRAPAGRRPERVRDPGPGSGDQPVGEARVHRSQVLSFDAYLRFIEDRFLSAERLDPATLSRPDSRPTVREEAPILGDLWDEFDFTQEPIPPLILDPRPGGQSSP
jgi:hypothetical protein